MCYKLLISGFFQTGLKWWLLKKIMDKMMSLEPIENPTKMMSLEQYFSFCYCTISNLIYSNKFNVSVRKRTNVYFPMKITCLRNINWICSITINREEICHVTYLLHHSFVFYVYAAAWSSLDLSVLLLITLLLYFNIFNLRDDSIYFNDLIACLISYVYFSF